MFCFVESIFSDILSTRTYLRALVEHTGTQSIEHLIFQSYFDMTDNLRFNQC
jgi:hypothetical protein